MRDEEEDEADDTEVVEMTDAFRESSTAFSWSTFDDDNEPDGGFTMIVVEGVDINHVQPLPNFYKVRWSR
jgi:hypothetical protein